MMSSPLCALVLGLIMLVIALVTADPFRSGLVGSVANPPSPSAFWLFLIGCLLVTVGACSLIDVTPA